MRSLQSLSSDIQQYLIITGNYWAFTLTDGALRMLVVLHFHELGYTPLEIALLFIFYEVFGIITNLVGGWLGAIIGLNTTMNIGLVLQVLALSMLLVAPEMLTIVWVMAAQAISGVAKDLNKMSAKSAIKLLVPKEANNTLYKWVALLTGSKNTLKGVGFFLGGLLLSQFGFHNAVLIMVVGLLIVWLTSCVLLKKELGKASSKPKFKHLFSKSSAINYLSGARLFLFAARDVWFVVALPVYLTAQFNWDYSQVGSVMALWVIGYGVVQALAPRLSGQQQATKKDGQHLYQWAVILFIIPMLMAIALHYEFQISTTLWLGLAAFGVLFAINSSLHSYLIVSYANSNGVSLDVGFYYMANAAGRLLGTVLSGWLYQYYSFEICLWVSAGFILFSAIIAKALPEKG
ncbi:organoarsenical effux MFS transporter ArsJ [Cycloclasticus sp. P1]|uniref:organoarsenical effux MFS transporter ArsJ n=1 Tax=Cycloclasticus sp. (strain P1) TaxID=385025 RepID=UPI000286AB23|nr:organoarsenical effux MFS transporter ArsJ [Cycloclasticus sp. P1]AFT67379.1 Permease of the major facilitator superfamily / multidrug efflux transporter [Cycloclasticus sp. P1]